MYYVALPLKPGAALVRSDTASLKIRNILQPHQVQVQFLAVKEVERFPSLSIKYCIRSEIRLIQIRKSIKQNPFVRHSRYMMSDYPNALL